MFVRLSVQVIQDKAVKFRDHGLNRSREMRPNAVIDGISVVFDDNCRPEVVGDIMPGAAVDYLAMRVRIKFGDSWLNSI